MAQNVDSLNGTEDIENIISSPGKNGNKELSIDEECKFGKVEKEIDSFGDISGIKNENNENLNDISLLIINKNISRSNLLRNKVVPKLDNIYNIDFDNFKRTELTYSTKKNFNTSNPRFNNNKKYEFLNFKTINNMGNLFNFQNFRNKINNDKKYNLLFEENKELDINSLREYFKFKKNNLNSNYYTTNQNLNKNKPKKYINIFNDNSNGKISKTLYNSINFNFDNFTINNRQNKFINFYAKKDYFKDIYKSNNNSKKNINKEKIKFKIFDNELTKNKSSYSFLSIYNNHNDKNAFFINSFRDLNKSKNTKKQDSSWQIKNYKKKIQINSLLNKNDKIIDKYQSKNILNTSPIFTEFDYNNKNNSKNKYLDFKLISSKLFHKDYNKNSNAIKNKILQIDRNNRINNEFHYSKNEEKENNNNLSNLKNKKISFNKLTENNSNFSEKLNGNYEKVFNLLDNKINLMLNNKLKKTRFNEFNSRYKSKLNYCTINPKLLSFSQNDSIKNNLMDKFKENNKINYMENDFKFPSRNKLSIQMTENISPFKKAINKDLNFDFFHSSNNEHEFTIKKNKAKNLLNLL